MRIVIAPDSFKGSLDAAAVAEAIAEGIGLVRPDAVVDCVPMADGGEGTLKVLVAAQRGQTRQAAATGPLGEPLTAAIGLIDGASTAIVELASAAGLTLVPEARRDPLVTTTFGAGELIRTVLDAGVDRVVLALGGSATVDGGAGLIQALGAALLDREGRVMPAGIGGGQLTAVQSISSVGLHARLPDVRVVIACDVLNPLCGPNGAAAVFAPQKGADSAAVQALDAGLAHWSGVLEHVAGRSLRDEPGAGAAGGAALPLLALADAELTPGVDLVIETVGLHERLAGADLVVTGEGRLDGQTRMGKVVDGVLRLAESCGVPCAAVCGGIGPGGEEVRARLDDCTLLSDLAGSSEAAQRDAWHWLVKAGRRLATKLPRR